MKFQLTVRATATIEETWEVEAENAEQAKALFDDRNDSPFFPSFISDRVVGDEEDREVIRVTPC